MNAADAGAPQYVCDLLFGGSYWLLLQAGKGHMEGFVNECRQPFPRLLALFDLDDALFQKDTANGALALHLALHDPDFARHVISRRPFGAGADTTPCSCAGVNWLA